MSQIADFLKNWWFSGKRNSKKPKIRMTLDYNQIEIFKKIIKISFLLIFQIPILVIYLSTWITHHSTRLRFQTDFTQVHIVMLHTFLIYIWYTLHQSRFSYFEFLVIRSWIIIYGPRKCKFGENQSLIPKFSNSIIR